MFDESRQEKAEYTGPMNALQRVTRSLETDIRDLPFGSRLPALRELARKYETSCDTLIDALRKLAELSLVHIRNGRKGYFAGPRQEHPEGTEGLRPSPSSVDRCMRAITSDLCRGKLGPGQYLPSQLELAARLGVSSLTVRRALKRMVDSGLLQQIGARYMPPSLSFDTRNGSAICVAASPIFLTSLHAHALTAVRSIERTVEALGWGQIRWLLVEGSPERIRAAKGIPDHMVSGYIHFATHHYLAWQRLFKRQPRVPLVVIDADESNTGWTRQLSPKLFRIVPDNARAGREAARHLALLGHREIAGFYCTDFPKDGWCGKRMTGLRKFDSSAGLSIIRVHDFACARNTRAVLSKAAASDVERLRKTLRGTGAFPDEIISREVGSLYNTVSRLDLLDCFRPLFEQALQNGKITAWVCVHDDLAVVAYQFLRSKGVRIPDDISLVGFDNSEAAYHLRLTTYDFEFEAIGNMAIRCLVSPQLMRPDPEGSIVVPGRLIPRNTTGPAI